MGFFLIIVRPPVPTPHCMSLCGAGEGPSAVSRHIPGWRDVPSAASAPRISREAIEAVVARDAWLLSSFEGFGDRPLPASWTDDGFI